MKIVLHHLEIEESISSSDSDVIEAFNNVMERVDINSQAHSVSYIREQINSLLTEHSITNRQVSLLIFISLYLEYILHLRLIRTLV